MKQVYPYQFINKLKEDFNICTKEERVLKLPANIKNFRTFTRGKAHEIRIFDGIKEHPYMLTDMRRNEKALKNAIELRYLANIPLATLIKKYNLPVQTANCRICEGNGWTSSGTKYSYKNIYIEI